MMIRFLFVAMLFMTGCNSEKKTKSNIRPSLPSSVTNTDTVTNFFPVTTYLKGEIYEIKNKGITPLKKTTINEITDSSWVKVGDLEKEFAPFLNPVIDSANLKNSFIEKKFLDQTLNAFTFTYDPINENTTTFVFKHWDVYVDPDNNKVKRIYLTKKIAADTELRLTWQSGKWCKIVTLKTTAGKTNILKEEKISWSFEE